MRKKIHENRTEYLKEYNKTRKKIACNVDNDMYDKIKLHAEKKGYKSLNSYVFDLIKKDMES